MRHVNIYAKPIPAFDALLIFFAGIMLFTYGLFDHEFIQFESRLGLFAQEMLRNGISFFPTTYNAPYPDYPATQTILVYLLSLITGKVTIYTAVLPSAIAAALTLSLTYLIGATQSRALGLYAVMFELFTYEFFASARSVTLDPFVTLATTLCFYLAFTANHYHQKWRVFGIIAGLVMGFFLRGPIGLVIPAAVVGGFYLLERDYRMLLRLITVASILLVSGMLLLLAAATYQGGLTFAKNVIVMQVAGRIADTETMPFFYFISALANYAISFPLAILVVGFFAPHFLKMNEHPTARFVLHLTAWIFIILVGLSIPGAKKIRYILPIVPAISLLAAYVFAGPSTKFLLFLRSILVKFCYVLPFLGLVLIPACLITARMKSILINAHFFSAAVLLMIQALAAVLLDKKLQGSPKHTPVLCAIGLAAFVTINIFMVEPINISLNRVQPFVEQVMSQRTQKETIAFYKIGPDAEDIKFMVALNQPLQPEFIYSSNNLVNVNKPTIFIAKQEDFEQLPKDLANKIKILVNGKIGHKKCVAFVTKAEGTR